MTHLGSILLSGLGGALIGAAVVIGWSAYRAIQRHPAVDPFAPHRDDSPKVAAEIAELRSSVEYHVRVHIRGRYQSALARTWLTPPLTGVHALRWLYQQEGVIYFQRGKAIVPSGQQVDLAAVVSTVLRNPCIGKNADPVLPVDSAQEHAAAELAVRVIDNARRATR